MKNIILITIILQQSLVLFGQKNLVGEKAPKLKVKQWIYPNLSSSNMLNKEVPENLNGHIIVLDFWFTTCAPCVASIPDLNHLSVHYPEITFLSITFEQENIVYDFLDKMKILYPVGIDNNKKTIEAFGVHKFPETFVIDKKGVVQWQGSPFDLDEKILDEVLGQVRANQKITQSNVEFSSENHAYLFTINEHTLDMGEASYYHYEPYDINVLNKNLKDILSVFYTTNKARILCKDSSMLNIAYDLTLKADKSLTTEANCVEMLKYLLPKEMGMQFSKVEKDTIVGRMKIENDTLLTKHQSIADFFGTTFTDDTWTLKGASFTDLKNFIENNYNILVVTEEFNKLIFDFILPAKDFEKVKEMLELNYGITIETTRQKTNFLYVEKDGG